MIPKLQLNRVEAQHTIEQKQSPLSTKSNRTRIQEEANNDEAEAEYTNK